MLVKCSDKVFFEVKDVVAAHSVTLKNFVPTKGEEVRDLPVSSKHMKLFVKLVEHRPFNDDQWSNEFLSELDAEELSVFANDVEFLDCYIVTRAIAESLIQRSRGLDLDALRLLIGAINDYSKQENTAMEFDQFLYFLGPHVEERRGAYFSYPRSKLSRFNTHVSK